MTDPPGKATQRLFAVDRRTEVGRRPVPTRRDGNPQPCAVAWTDATPNADAEQLGPERRSMSPSPEDQWRPPEPPNRTPRQGGPGSSPKSPNRPRWMPWVLVALVVGIFLVWQAAPSTTPARTSVDYSKFLQLVTDGHVQSIKYEASTGKIT